MSMFVAYILGHLIINSIFQLYFQQPTEIRLHYPRGFDGYKSASILLTMTSALQKRGRRRWLIKLRAIVLWGLGWGMLAIL